MFVRARKNTRARKIPFVLATGIDKSLIVVFCAPGHKLFRTANSDVTTLRSLDVVARPGRRLFAPLTSDVTTMRSAVVDARRAAKARGEG